MAVQVAGMTAARIMRAGSAASRAVPSAGDSLTGLPSAPRAGRVSAEWKQRLRPALTRRSAVLLEFECAPRRHAAFLAWIKSYGKRCVFGARPVGMPTEKPGRAAT